MSLTSRAYPSAQVQPPKPNYSSGFWLQRFVPEDLRLSRDEQLSESTVYGAIRAIVDPLSAADWNVIVKANGKRESLGDGELWYLLNVRPNPDQPATAVKEAVLTSSIVNGSGYLAINRNRAGKAEALWPLEFDRVQLVRDPETQDLYYVYTQPDGDLTILPGSDVVHLRGPTMSGLSGDSLVDRASPSISLAVAQSRFAQNFFQNAGVLSGYLKFANAVSDPAVIGRIKADWNSKHGGVGKAHKTAVLEGGEFVPLSTDAEKSQLNDSRIQSVQDIARMFRVPLVLLQLAISSQGYGSNVTMFFEMFVRDGLSIWRRRIEQEVQYKLCPQRAPWAEIEVDLSFLTKGNAFERAQTNEILIRSGQATPNECRISEGRDTIEGGDVLLLNGQPLDRIVNPPPPPAPEPEPEEEEQDQEMEEHDGQEHQGEEMPMHEEAQALLRAGVCLALDNHRRRWVARTKDIPEDKVPAAREELRAKLAHDLRAFDGFINDEQFAALATQVEQGFEPEKAVSLLERK